MRLGELIQICIDEGIVCCSIHASDEKAKLIIAQLDDWLDNGISEKEVSDNNLDSSRQESTNPVQVVPSEIVNSVADHSINTEELLEQLSEAEKLATLNSVPKDGAEKQVKHTDGLKVIKTRSKSIKMSLRQKNKNN